MAGTTSGGAKRAISAPANAARVPIVARRFQAQIGLRTLAIATSPLATATRPGGRAAAAPSSTPTPTVGEVEAFASLPASSEGLAFGPGPDGETNLYVGVRSHQVVRIAPDGTVTEHASIPEPVGVALGADGALVVCGTTSSTEPGAEAVSGV